ncbi:MAG TPA: hypothetical protein VFS40_05230 [Gemmatimonadales bacterium]|nr:hypothetical protein [Gemmatimonadales bacterium]
MGRERGCLGGPFRGLRPSGPFRGRLARRLARYGLAGQLLDDLAAAVDRFAASLAESADARHDHVVAREELKAAARRLMQIVALLDGLNLYRFSEDVALRTAWQRLRRLDAEPRPHGGAEVKPAA